MTPADTGRGRSDWPTIWIATLGGAAAAMQVGKAGAALPSIRDEFGLSVSTLALYVSLLSLVAATMGLGFGLMTRRIGLRRAASAGLALLALASLLPVFVTGGVVLLASRAVEALGFALCTTSLPAMVRAAASPRRQSLAMGIWAAWMPAGVVLSLGAAALVQEPLGWRALFVVCAIAPLLALGALRLAAGGPGAEVAIPAMRRLRDTLMRPEVARTSAVFVLFSGANMVYMGFLPTILVDERAMSLSQANRLTLVSVLCLIPFNLGTGWLLDRSVSAARLYVVALVVMAVTPAMILGSAAGGLVMWAGAVLYGAAAGVVPAVVWAQVSRLTRSPDEAPLVSGSIYQGAGIGQILAPLAVGWSVRTGGNWWPAIVVIAALCAAAVGVVVLARAPRQ